MTQMICRDLSLGYDGLTVSEHVSFHVCAGDYLCIVGDNGSGKSTLVKTILGLKAPDGGQLELSREIGRNDIGYLPQQSELQRDFPASVREVVLSGCVGRRDFRLFATGPMRRLAEEQMERLGISHLANRSYSRLSGGQQQRVLLARALCGAGKILLLDEPTAALDPTATEELYETVRRLNREEGVTVIMVTHDLSAVMRYATSVLHMSRTPTFYESAEAYGKSADFPGREVAQ